MESNSRQKDFRSTLLVIEGLFIIILVLFSGFMAYRNKILVRQLQETLVPTPTPTPSPSPSPTLPTATASASPKSSLSPVPTVKATLLPTPAP